MMNVPLEVIQDAQGRLRDLNDQPMIMIFNSKPRRPRTSRRSRLAKEKHSALGPQPYKFINVTKPKDKDEDTRRLIRTHVMQNLLRRERHKFGSGLEVLTGQIATGDKIPHHKMISHTMPSQPLVAGPTVVVFPVQMQPYMRRLIHQYSSLVMHITDPKQPANPADSAWFPMVMTDPALFHIILSTSAIYVGLISGRQDVFSENKHMLEAISLINGRLQRTIPGCTTDATITTILFMAKAEYARGNLTSWAIHMNGLKRIIKLRGGLVTLSNLLRQKIYSAELMGCMETGSRPRFSFVDSSLPFGPMAISPSLPPGIENLVQKHVEDKHLFTLVGEIENYTQALKTGLASSIELEPATVHIRYQLLSWIDQSCIDNQRSTIQQSLRLGAIVYFESLLPKQSVRSINYTVMLSSLKSHLLGLDITQLSSVSLLLWLLFLGGCASDFSYRTWFTAKLLEVTAQAGISTWDDVKTHLIAFWWVESIHGEPCQKLWEEAQMMSVTVH